MSMKQGWFIKGVNSFVEPGKAPHPLAHASSGQKTELTVVSKMVGLYVRLSKLLVSCSGHRQFGTPLSLPACFCVLVFWPSLLHIGAIE